MCEIASPVVPDFIKQPFAAVFALAVSPVSAIPAAWWPLSAFSRGGVSSLFAIDGI
jgi:hypothetical protein